MRLFHNMARSGGTLLSRCIASMENICLLSEIHPFGRTNRHFNPIRQYQRWYRDLGVDWRQAGFDRSIDRIADDCATQGLTLVLRDWAHIDFLGPPSQKPPGFTLLLDQRLASRYSLRHVALVRHPAETWRSTGKMKLILENGIELEQFLHAYRNYLEAVQNYTIVRYEDFTAEPKAVMKQICGALDLSYDPGFVDRWSDYVNVTGDMFNNSRAGGSREIKHFDIRPLESPLRERYLENADYRWIIERLGYLF